MSRFRFLSILVLIIIQGCSGGLTTNYQQLYSNTFALGLVEEIYIEIRAGVLEIQSVPGQDLSISSQLIEPDYLEINQNKLRLEISHERSQDIDLFQVQVPEGSKLNIKTFSANVEIEDFLGDVMVNSSAGQLTATGLSGSATLLAGRGDIAVSNSRGNIILISEHGAIDVEGVVGELSMSTIMGGLTYTGVKNDQNMIQIEADHGPVRVVLPASSNTFMQATSTSGEVVCLGPGVIYTVGGCQATAGAGTGTIAVRTVSGRIELVISDQMETD